ncbi:MAG: hypothetical protein EA397_11540 [Deltaproteobacteria bacterium]|nr:MAG: hypothetical protein EA397_11540 [Deltaproteobacteria bacterium]
MPSDHERDPETSPTPPPQPERAESPPRSAEEPAEESAKLGDDRPRTGLRRRLQRLLDRRELAEDTREVLGGMLEMSDRAKTEAVRLVAREVRNYLEELKIKEDLLNLATSHSLELKLSVQLKPLAEAVAKSSKSTVTSAPEPGRPSAPSPADEPEPA